MKLLAICSDSGRLKTVDIQNATAVVLTDIHGNRVFVAGEHGISGLISMSTYKDTDFNRLTQQFGLSPQQLQVETLGPEKGPHFS